jgi:hypothetical protein
MENTGALKRKGLGGGRARTRTEDLLRVKQALQPTAPKAGALPGCARCTSLNLI